MTQRFAVLLFEVLQTEILRRVSTHNMSFDVSVDVCSIEDSFGEDVSDSVEGT